MFARKISMFLKFQLSIKEKLEKEFPKISSTLHKSFQSNLSQFKIGPKPLVILQQNTFPNSRNQVTKKQSKQNQ